MDMLGVLSAASDSSNVAYHDFLLFYKPGQSLVYGFVEGKQDPSYYRSAIDPRLPNGWRCKLIPAGSKSKVLQLYGLMDWVRFPKKAICFFVDRDLSDFIPSARTTADNLFISDNYSIENDIISLYTFERLLEEVYGISGLWPNELNRIYELFQHNIKLFTESLSCVMAQIIILRRSESKTATEILIARLDKIKPHAFFEYQDGALKLKPEFNSPERRVAHACAAVEAAVADAVLLKQTEAEFIMADGPARFTRGKYLIRFFIDCADAIRDAIPAFSSRFKAPPWHQTRAGSRSGCRDDGAAN